MFVQNIIKLSVAINKLSCTQREKNSTENNTVHRYRVDRNNYHYYIINGAPLMPIATQTERRNQRRSQQFDLGGYKWVKETKQPHKTI